MSSKWVGAAVMRNYCLFTVSGGAHSSFEAYKQQNSDRRTKTRRRAGTPQNDTPLTANRLAWFVTFVDFRLDSL